ncbi:hypothetical protein BaOVIS_025680 [Babesia ovis]|uniref:Uncharacterized protein n=1 Tax=Babesia ovis TaxID=5869 RepID=A0A9W5TEU9_BABOV|nr:hypothetical protein BaOVIS_025680 [Babesia ovis]
MQYCSRLEAMLPRLRLMSRNPALVRSNVDSQGTSQTVKKFKRALSAAIKDNAISDDTIVQAADCLYDLKACDPYIGTDICNAVESRPGVYTKALSGGVLWACHTARGQNNRRKKAVKSSGAATVEAFMDELVDIQNEESRCSTIQASLRNLGIVGQCYTLPVSTRARLEQALCDASVSLSHIMKSSNIVVSYMKALVALQLRKEMVAEDAVKWFVEAVSHDVLSTGEVTKTLCSLQNWPIGVQGKERKALEYILKELENPPSLLLKSPSSLVKFYVAASRVPAPRKASKQTVTDITTVIDDTKQRVNEGGEGDLTVQANYTGVGGDLSLRKNDVESHGNVSDTMQAIGGVATDMKRSHECIRVISGVLLRYCCEIINRCTALNLLLLYNSLSHHIRRDGIEVLTSNLMKYIDTVGAEMLHGLELDASAQGNNSQRTVELYTQQDLITIYRAAVKMNDIYGKYNANVADLAKNILEQRYNFDANSLENVTAVLSND